MNQSLQVSALPLEQYSPQEMVEPGIPSVGAALPDDLDRIGQAAHNQGIARGNVGCAGEGELPDARSGLARIRPVSKAVKSEGGLPVRAGRNWVTSKAKQDA